MEKHGSLDNARVGDHLKPCDMSVEREREEERRKNESIKFNLTISEFSSLKLMQFLTKIAKTQNF